MSPFARPASPLARLGLRALRALHPRAGVARSGCGHCEKAMAYFNHESQRDTGATAQGRLAVGGHSGQPSPIQAPRKIRARYRRWKTERRPRVWNAEQHPQTSIIERLKPCVTPLLSRGPAIIFPVIRPICPAASRPARPSRKRKPSCFPPYSSISTACVKMALRRRRAKVSSSMCSSPLNPLLEGLPARGTLLRFDLDDCRKTNLYQPAAVGW